MVVSIATWTSAQAGTLINWSCVRGPYGYNCSTQRVTTGDPYVRTVPEALGEAEQSRLAARDSKWVARCRPVIDRDRYGVGRYRYSAAGCQFGVGAD
jgi:hypothetical protein